VWIPP
jgi:hypothetical protein